MVHELCYFIAAHLSSHSELDRYHKHVCDWYGTTGAGWNNHKYDAIDIKSQKASEFWVSRKDCKYIVIMLSNILIQFYSCYKPIKYPVMRLNSNFIILVSSHVDLK